MGPKVNHQLQGTECWACRQRKSNITCKDCLAGKIELGATLLKGLIEQKKQNEGKAQALLEPKARIQTLAELVSRKRKKVSALKEFLRDLKDTTEKERESAQNAKRSLESKRLTLQQASSFVASKIDHNEIKERWSTELAILQDQLAKKQELLQKERRSKITQLLALFPLMPFSETECKIANLRAPYDDKYEHLRPEHVFAVLSYARQLLLLLSWFLEVRLPNSIPFQDIAGSSSDRSFRRAWARMNFSLCHLAWTQGVNVPRMKATHTLSNMLLCLRSPTLGRSGPNESGNGNEWYGEELENEGSDGEEWEKVDMSDLGDD
eukprot:Colp12_sorted_trinity150504_noHs@21079